MEYTNKSHVGCAGKVLKKGSFYECKTCGMTAGSLEAFNEPLDVESSDEGRPEPSEPEGDESF
jgi:hypothetical protein